jgi:hypothetical protein
VHLVDKPFYPELEGFMRSSPITGDHAVTAVRAVAGPTNPAKADPGRLWRGCHGQCGSRFRLAGDGRGRVGAVRIEIAPLSQGQPVHVRHVAPAPSESVRRIHPRFMRSKGLRRGGKGSVRLYTEQHLQSARVLDWARTGDCQPIDFAAPLACQPF